jgi:murein DD-endopeptidase MepM/ murein hydrolase activator NlpD
MVHLAIDRPPSSDRPRSSGGLLLVAVAAALVAAAFGGGFWVGRATAPAIAAAPAESPAAPRLAEAVPGAPPAGTAAPAQGAAPAPGSVPAAGAAASPAAGSASPAPGGAPVVPSAPAAAPAPPVASPYRRAVVTVSGPLEESIAKALAPEDRASAEELTAVVNRLLVWDFQVRTDGRKGDRLEILWSPPAPAAPGVPVAREPTVEAIRYASSKLGAVIAAYRFHPQGARWARHYRTDGSEVESRLVDGPIADYEQVTSLLRDGRRHKGVDFKTPVGSPVVAPFDGVVERRNWNFAGNGNCLDLRDAAGGRHAIFLHLDVLPKEIAVGRRVKKGEVIASSGNSGHSFAPHLHYQVEDAAGRVLDPFAVHRTERRALGAPDRAAFEAARAKLDAQLSM